MPSASANRMPTMMDFAWMLNMFLLRGNAGWVGRQDQPYNIRYEVGLVLVGGMGCMRAILGK